MSVFENNALLEKHLLRLGTEFQIIGMILGNDVQHLVTLLPKEVDDNLENVEAVSMFHLDDEVAAKVFKQLDVQDIEGPKKVILRKSQRKQDAKINWQVFRRDNFTCQYCGANDVPMTVDHIVLWEAMGDTHPDNLICSCSKCNRTRGSQHFDDWLKRPFLHDKVKAWLKDDIHVLNHLYTLEGMGTKAKEVPLRTSKRSR